jgi:hypothetical protein
MVIQMSGLSWRCLVYLWTIVILIDGIMLVTR